MSSPHYNILYLDTHNSARSIMAEAILNHKSGDTITAYSAGCQPSETVNPLTRELLVRAGISTAPLQSKSVNKFTTPSAPPMQFVITLWDNASHSPSPSLPGSPAMVNWPVSDPLYLTSIAIPPREIDRAFTGAFSVLNRHIDSLLKLPFSSLERPALQQKLERIGRL